MEGSKFYVTTAIDYTNDVIHIGHAYQKVLADILYRYHKLVGDDAYFLTGTDNHGGKTEEGAEKAGIPVEKFSKKISDEDEEQLKALNIKPSRFIRTTDPDHKKTVYKLYKKIKASGDIYLGKYEGLYCPGCEEFKTRRNLVDDKCPDHPTVHLETLAEDNYFFKLSKYQDFVTKHIEKYPEFVQPEGRRKEILSFLKNEPLKDTPISRPKVKWGIPFPEDKSHTFYVWFEALINYVTGAPAKYWPTDVHVLGKDNLRFHAVLWPAMLKSAGMKLPKTVYAHGFLSLEGKKISKSLGNIIRPKELAAEFGADAVRYYLARYGPLRKDADISRKHLKEVYYADLANGLGNLISRVVGLIDQHFGGKVPQPPKDPDEHPLRVNERIHNWKKVYKDLDESIRSYRFDEALASIWKFISAADKYVDESKPWDLSKKDKEELAWVIYGLADSIHQLGWILLPLLPETSKRIAKAFQLKRIAVSSPSYKDSWTNIKPGTQVRLKEALFPRIS